MTGRSHIHLHATARLFFSLFFSFHSFFIFPLISSWEHDCEISIFSSEVTELYQNVPQNQKTTFIKPQFFLPQRQNSSSVFFPKLYPAIFLHNQAEIVKNTFNIYLTSIYFVPRKVLSAKDIRAPRNKHSCPIYLMCQWEEVV